MAVPDTGTSRVKRPLDESILLFSTENKKCNCWLVVAFTVKIDGQCRSGYVVHLAMTSQFLEVELITALNTAVKSRPNFAS